jgi:hypothetical protein
LQERERARAAEALERAKRQEEAEAQRQAELAARRARLQDVKRAAADREEVRGNTAACPVLLPLPEPLCCFNQCCCQQWDNALLCAVV